jgi:hypothetical protein
MNEKNRFPKWTFGKIKFKIAEHQNITAQVIKYQQGIIFFLPGKIVNHHERSEKSKKWYEDFHDEG